ncbi:MAG: hypothetical protein V8S42_06230 [Lachnospiraceae bacterium]
MQAKINKGGFHRRSMDEFLIFLTGFVSGVLLIWHLMTVFLIVVFLAVAAFHAAQLLEMKDSKNRIFLIIRAVFCLAVLAP